MSYSYHELLMAQFKFITLVYCCRFMHSRLREHAESIAFFGGGFRERSVRFLD